MSKISKADLLMNRARVSELSDELFNNLHELETKLNNFFANYSGPLTLTSGFRPPSYNATLSNAGANSWHTKCAAADFADSDGKLWAYCMQNLSLAKQLGLWFEDKRWTPTWTHLQIYPPKSSRRIFVPSSKPATAPDAWTGTYEHKFD